MSKIDLSQPTHVAFEACIFSDLNMIQHSPGGKPLICGMDLKVPEGLLLKFSNWSFTNKGFQPGEIEVIRKFGKLEGALVAVGILIGFLTCLLGMSR